MIASLPMYDFPETRAAHVSFWQLVRDQLDAAGISAPKDLTPTGDPHAIWADDRLVLSHICNLPYRASHRHLTRIGASDYGLEGCAPGEYRSLLIVKTDHPAQTARDLDGATMAYNSADSHSGWGAPAHWAMSQSMRFNPTTCTGSHDRSLTAVANGEADFAAIDARSFAILNEIRPAARQVRVIGATPPSPGMTFVTRPKQDPAPYLAALRIAISRLDGQHRHWLGLRDVVPLPDVAYELPLPPNPDSWRPQPLHSGEIHA